MNKMTKSNKILIKTLFGLEETLKDELLNIGVKSVKVLNRAVETEGDIELIYKCNLYLRTALAVYLKIDTGITKNQNDLYDFIRAIKWQELFSGHKSIAVEAFTNSKTLKHSRFTEQKVKDGIVDYFRDTTGVRPQVNLERPDIKIYVHINNNTCSLYLNSSGTPLYYRGYNKRTGKAPVNDILAAGIILISGWDKKSFLYDPMCGCGTIPAEAYMLANNIPPTINRNYFSFKNWQNYDNKLWENIIEEAKRKINKTNTKIYGNDIDNKVLQDAQINFNRIDPENKIKLTNSDFFDIEPPDTQGTIISNPPYGMRFNDLDIKEFYKKLGDKLKFDYRNYVAWIISSELDALKMIGLRPEKKIVLFNGPLECKLNKYSIYEGSKKTNRKDYK